VTAPRITPVFEQYLRIKEEHPDTLLFFQMGDFYELFFEDAEVASRELQITLTSRNPGAEVKTPMCGVPLHAAESYLAQLLEKGYRVAVCDQIEDPRQAKGLVKRAVTRVLTPGTVVEDVSLSAKTPNFLAALVFDPDKGAGGLAWVEVSTGQWTGLYSRKESELWQQAQKIAPRELLLPPGRSVPTAHADLSALITPIPGPQCFDFKGAQRRVLAAQGVATLEVLDLGGKPQLVLACGALLAYLERTQLREAGHLGAFKPLNLSRHLILDEVTERNLEVFTRLDGKSGAGTLLSVLDRTATPMGGRHLRAVLQAPWRDPEPMARTQEAVAFLVERDEVRRGVRERLSRVYDLERLSTRISLGRATPRDFIALRESLTGLPDLAALLASALPKDGPPLLAGLVANWDGLTDVRELLDRALADSPPLTVTEGGLFKVGYHPELDELIGLAEHGEARMAALLEQEKAAHGLPRLKLGFNRVFGYYFELSRAAQGQTPIPEHFVRRQTLATGERYVTPALKELEDKLLSASEERKSLEYKLFQELRGNLAACRPRFLFMAQALAVLDFQQSLAEAARLGEWTRPELHAGLDLEIKAGRHPAVEAALGSGRYVPNDLLLDDARRILLITGPNMAGKSTVLRQAAIITLLAQIGSFVPAKKARIGLVDRIFCRVGASDNLARGHSTFMVEMMETARILRQAGTRALVVLDEIGRGTATFDGLALAWAVVEDLARRGEGGLRTLFATHYHELTDLEGRLPGVRNMNIAVKEWKGDIMFLRRLVPGPADKSYGIEVARLAGVPQPVVRRAREILAELEEKSHGVRTARPRPAAASQTLLPGLTPDQDTPPPPGDHPILAEIKTLNPDRLTPFEALSLLGEWKRRLDSEE
jgi:DNA mismatch repair protein MutS